jgi:hypothetical protein
MSFDAESSEKYKGKSELFNTVHAKIGAIVTMMYIEPPLGEIKAQLVESMHDDTHTGFEQKMTESSPIGHFLLNHDITLGQEVRIGRLLVKFHNIVQPE